MADDNFQKFKKKYKDGEIKKQAGVPPVGGPVKGALGAGMRATIQYGKMGMEKARPLLNKPVREVAKDAVQATTKANAKSGSKAKHLKEGAKSKKDAKPLNRGAERLQKKMEGWRGSNAVKRASKEKDPGSMAARARAVSRKPESRPADGGSRALVKREDRMPANLAGREVAKQESRALATQGSRAVARREGGGGNVATIKPNAVTNITAGSVAGSAALDVNRKTFARTAPEGGGGNVAKGPVKRREGGGGNVASAKPPKPTLKPEKKTDKGATAQSNKDKMKSGMQGQSGKNVFTNKSSGAPSAKSAPKRADKPKRTFGDAVRGADAGDSFIQNKRGNKLRSWK